MIERLLTLTNPAGLHARPASLLVQTANRFPGTQVFVCKGEQQANARSLLALMSLGAGPGTAVLVRCEGPQEAEAMAALAELVESGLG